MKRRQMQLDFSGIKTYSAENRHNLVTIDNMMTPGVTPHSVYSADGFDELIERIIKARKDNRPVIWSMGAHVVKTTSASTEAIRMCQSIHSTTRFH